MILFVQYTLDVYRDPVLAGDSHVYECAAIIRWIEQQGTSPLTRERLDVNDLRSEENIKQLCQPHQSNSVIYSCQTGMVSLPNLPMTQSDICPQKTELVINGHFENNPSNGFFYCNSYGNSSTTLFLISSYPYNGKYSFCDGTVGLPDYLSQTLNTKVGHVYRVLFWLQNQGDAPNSAQVVMSY